jgi:hypothetical protein
MKNWFWYKKSGPSSGSALIGSRFWHSAKPDPDLDSEKCMDSDPKHYLVCFQFSATAVNFLDSEELL